MNVSEAAKRLEVSRATIYGLIACGKLKCARVGVKRGVIRIQDAHLAEFLSGSESVSPSPPAPVRKHNVKLRNLNLD
jgi:excisionase family DNA binding protein